MGSGRTLMTLLTLLLPVGAAGAGDIPYAMSDHPSQDGRCEGDTGKADLDRSEKACLQQLKDVASRKGKLLRLKFRDGSRRNYINRPSEELKGREDDAIEYKLTGYFPKLDLVLLEIGYWEGAQWMLVRLDSGKETKLHAPPHLSPGQEWLFSVCSSDGPSGCGNGMDIVPAGPDPKRHEWHYLVPDNDYTLYEFEGWDGDNRVKLTATFDAGDGLKPFPASLECVNGVWHLELPKAHERATRR